MFSKMYGSPSFACATPVDNLRTRLVQPTDLYKTMHNFSGHNFHHVDLYKFYTSSMLSLYTGTLVRFSSVISKLYTVSTVLTTKTIYKYIIKEY